MSDSKQFMQPAEEDDGINWNDEPEKVQSEEPEYEDIELTERIGVDFKWQECKVDPIDFKPYSPLIIPNSVNIRIYVPAQFVISKELIEGTNIASECTLSLDGYTYCQNALARAIKKAFIQ